MDYLNWLRFFSSFRILTVVILSSAFLTSVAFTAAPEYQAPEAMHYSVQPAAEYTTRRTPFFCARFPVDGYTACICLPGCWYDYRQG